VSGYLSNEGENLMLLSFDQLVDDFESQGWTLRQKRSRTIMRVMFPNRNRLLRSRS
jgi:hypothetical protein